MNWNQELFVRSLLRHREGASMLGAHNTVPLFVDCYVDMGPKWVMYHGERWTTKRGPALQNRSNVTLRGE